MESPSTSTRPNLVPTTWGPHWWKMLESIYHHYPKETNVSLWTDEDRRYISSVATLLSVMKDLLPCQECQSHYRSFLETHPIDENVLLEKSFFWEWLYQLRSAIRPQQSSSIELHQQSERYFFPPQVAVLSSAIPRSSLFTTSRQTAPLINGFVTTSKTSSNLNRKSTFAHGSSSVHPLGARSFRATPSRSGGCNCR